MLRENRYAVRVGELYVVSDTECGVEVACSVKDALVMSLEAALVWAREAESRLGESATVVPVAWFEEDWS